MSSTPFKQTSRDERTGRGRADYIERRSAGVVRTGLKTYSAQGAGYKSVLGCVAAVACIRTDCLAFGQINKIFSVQAADVTTGTSLKQKKQKKTRRSYRNEMTMKIGHDGD